MGTWPGFNRILRGLPNIPRLTCHLSPYECRREQCLRRPTVKKIPSRRSPARCFALRVVIPSMHASLIAGRELSRCASTRACLATLGRVAPKSPRVRHERCIPPVFLKKVSHSLQESVDFSPRRAKVCGGCSSRSRTGSRRPAGRRAAGRQAGWIHGAARNGNRKRTRVRVACGGGIRPRGLGHQPFHGHFGLSVVGRETFSPVVQKPACELRVRQRHFSRGPGLLAALMPGIPPLARMSPLERRPADHPTVGATRPVGCTVIRARSVLTCPPERPAAGRGAHHPSPRTRLRRG